MPNKSSLPSLAEASPLSNTAAAAPPPGRQPRPPAQPPSAAKAAKRRRATAAKVRAVGRAVGRTSVCLAQGGAHASSSEAARSRQISPRARNLQAKDEAASYLTRTYGPAIDEDCGDGNRLFQFALLLENVAGDYAKAEEYYRLALEHDPDNIKISYVAPLPLFLSPPHRMLHRNPHTYTSHPTSHSTPPRIHHTFHPTPHTHLYPTLHLSPHTGIPTRHSTHHISPYTTH